MVPDTPVTRLCMGLGMTAVWMALRWSVEQHHPGCSDELDRGEGGDPGRGQPGGQEQRRKRSTEGDRADRRC